MKGIRTVSPLLWSLLTEICTCIVNFESNYLTCMTRDDSPS